MRTFADLQRELRRRGYYKKTPVRIIVQLVLHLTIIGLGAAVFFTAEPLWIRAIALFFAAAASVGVSTNGHTASHYATSDRRRLNEALTFFCYPFVNSVSAHFWWNKHITGHHPAPNVIGVDTDIDLMPWFTFTQEQYDSSPRWRRIYYRLQGLLIPIALFGLAAKMMVDSWSYVIRQLIDSKKRTPGIVLDLVMLLTHIGVWYVLPMMFLPWVGVLVFNFGRVLLGGPIMFSVFAPAHFPNEAAAVAPSTKPEDFVLLQTATTVNFRTGLLGRLLCAGVEYQIEHHLFCGISHVHYPAVSRLVEEFCREHGYPYRSLTWDVALWKSYLAFWMPRKTWQDLEDLREPDAVEPAPGAVPMTRSAHVDKVRSPFQLRSPV